jgi:hypothetical protein
MLQTARTRLREKEDSLSYVVQQRMQFSLGSLKLVVFPRTMEDNEMASFSASDLRSDLDLIVESSDLPAKRKLHLAFSGMSTSRVGPLNHGAVPADVRTDVRQWLGALRKDTPVSTIFEFPAMDMEMESEEASGVLEYDFVSQFARGDIYRRQERGHFHHAEHGAVFVAHAAAEESRTRDESSAGSRLGGSSPGCWTFDDHTFRHIDAETQTHYYRVLTSRRGLPVLHEPDR